MTNRLDVNNQIWSFNRTFMELKWWNGQVSLVDRTVLIVPLWNWNKIKLVWVIRKKLVLIVPLWNWNLTYFATYCGAAPVLIVPLWNWNRIPPARLPTPEIVLIVPLWNWNHAERHIVNWLKGFNRTFMELKCRSLFCSRSSQNVLIVPLWNWNRSCCANQGIPYLVLIVPLWNWNYKAWFGWPD